MVNPDLRLTCPLPKPVLHTTSSSLCGPGISSQWPALIWSPEHDPLSCYFYSIIFVASKRGYFGARNIQPDCLTWLESPVCPWKPLSLLLAEACPALMTLTVVSHTYRWDSPPTGKRKPPFLLRHGGSSRGRGVEQV